MEVNELMVSWWWEVIGIVGMICGVAFSGGLIWYVKILEKEREKFKKQKTIWDDDYGKIWDLKDKFRDEKERLTEENATLKMLVDNRNDAITVLDNENKTLKKLLEENTVLKVGYSSFPTQEFEAGSVENARKIEVSEIENTSRLEKLYSEAIKAMRTYSVDADVCGLEEELYENDN